MLLAGLYAAPAPAGTRNFVALLNAGQETPPTTSDALGVAFVTFDDKTRQLCYSISFTRLSNGTLTATVAHLHGPAAPGVAMPNPIIGLLPPFTNPMHDCVTLPAPNKKDLKRGLTYLNIHSKEFPAGEIRGQVIPVK